MDHSDELCKLFSTAISTLASDAAILQKLCNLQTAVVSDEGGRKKQSLNDNAVLSQLRSLDQAVTAVESKVRMLQEIVADEKRSLQELEVVQKATEAQSLVLDHMLKQREYQLGSEYQQEQHEKENQRHQLGTAQHAKPKRRDSIDPRKQHRQKPHHPSTNHVINIRIPLVTESELLSVSRAIRGRITLAVVNDALSDIQRVGQNKYSALSKPKQHSYQKQWNDHAALQVEEHGDLPWVSEQDLRQSCAFFRSGESTARGILSILRTLKRLKQVPARNSEVTYILQTQG
jgi:hypothetical protein